MEQLKEKLFTESATATGGREGHVTSENKTLDFDISLPIADNHDAKAHTNPEELFAATYAVCYDGALNLVAKKAGHDVTTETTADVDFGKTESGFGIAVHLSSKIDGVDENTAKDLMEKAHEVCPYSKATRGNIEVTLQTK